MGSKPVHIKVFIDKKKKKVMFAEAEEDFVEILFSFLTLPLGTIARISSKHGDSKDIKFGSLNSLYESVENLDNKHFSNEHCKVALVTPNSSSLSLCQKLKVNLNDTKLVDALVSDATSETVFVQKKASFIITDDLNVIPVMLDTSISLLNSLGVEYIDLLEEIPKDFGFEEFSNLLKWSLVTNNPLTNLVLGGISDDIDSKTVSTVVLHYFKFNTFGVPVSDIEVMEVSIGEQEALLILKAALSSTSTLTDCTAARFRKGIIMDLNRCQCNFIR
ncbi:hypothetical protein Tco_0690588 [Tanacetum coccineum]